MTRDKFDREAHKKGLSIRSKESVFEKPWAPGFSSSLIALEPQKVGQKSQNTDGMTWARVATSLARPLTLWFQLIIAQFGSQVGEDLGVCCHY